MTTFLHTFTVATTPFGNALRTVREAQRISQTKLALKAGFDHSFVSRLEGGTRDPSRDAVVTLAGALDLDVVGRDELLVAAGFMPGDLASLLADEPDVVDLLALLQDNTMPGDYRDSVRFVLRALVSTARMYVDKEIAA